MADFSALLPSPAPQGAGNFAQLAAAPTQAVTPGGYSQPGASPLQFNLGAANAALNLTPQEQALYQMHLRNLTGPGGVDHPDGSRSSLYQSVEQNGGKYYNIPTVWNGKIETEQWKDPQSGKVYDVANKTALGNVAKLGWDNFPSYATPEEADRRYDDMHKFMDKDTALYLASRNNG